MTKLADIVLAQQRIADYLSPTPLENAWSLDPSIWLKLECLNKTRSFKIRGALNAILQLTEAERSKGIVACSSGNHAQAVAYAASLVDVPATIFMPAHTPKRKVNGALHYGAKVDLSQSNYDEAELRAREYEGETGMTFISPYNDPQVIAGAGTIGLEILTQIPDVERVIVSVSGGGLISGIACAVKSLKPDCEVVGVSSVSTAAMYNIIYNKNLPQIWDTLAEALSGDVEQGSLTIDMTRQYVDRIELVTEEQIASAMAWMLENQAWVVEGGGSVGIAALLHGVIPIDQRKTVVVVTGGNVDTDTLRRVLGEIDTFTINQQVRYARVRRFQR